MTEYNVIRPHSGDKEYKVGDTRTARPIDVAHLVGRCLEEKKAGEPDKGKAAKPADKKVAKPADKKAEQPVQNQAAP
ncbi:MAG: hypothetical protein COB08_019365 [Rhodobacteraceae bacterium]|nr:hypothetical protein [Paracoccaceae bacterium]